jgi:hypothetical protein
MLIGSWWGVSFGGALTGWLVSSVEPLLAMGANSIY